MAFYRHVITAFYEFEKRHAEEIAAFAKHHKPATPANESQKIEKSPFTSVSESVNVSPVKPKLPSLLERLKSATSQRGKKTELAGFLGVSLVQVSQWLTGDREPGGETTLRLLHWVEQQERQK
jgi:DNA-binding transcriptional regulator YiaG